MERNKTDRTGGPVSGVDRTGAATGYAAPVNGMGMRRLTESSCDAGMIPAAAASRCYHGDGELTEHTVSAVSWCLTSDLSYLSRTLHAVAGPTTVTRRQPAA